MALLIWDFSKFAKDYVHGAHGVVARTRSYSSDVTDPKGNCVLKVYPGDTDMNGGVNLNDLNPIIKYWGKKQSILFNTYRRINLCVPEIKYE